MKLLVLTAFFAVPGLSSIAQDTLAINKFINAWHLAASHADARIFFDSMDKDAVYIGTDKTERWTKTEFESFAMPYFKKGKAWDFKPYNRDLHVTNDGNFAWFSELLNTWMGVCRGSGILKKTNQGWRIQQYHLSVTVPNEIIKDFIDLVNGAEKKKEVTK